MASRNPVEPEAAHTVAELQSVPFHWSGRAASAKFDIVGIVLLVASLLVLGTGLKSSLWTEPIALAVWGFLLVVLLLLIAQLFSDVRRRTVTVDDSEIECRGRLRLDFIAPWEQIGVIEIGRPPPAYPSSDIADDTFPTLVAIHARDGRRLGIVAVGTEIDAETGARFEDALRTFAQRHGTPVVDVPWGRNRWRWRGTPARRTKSG